MKNIYDAIVAEFDARGWRSIELENAEPDKTISVSIDGSGVDADSVAKAIAHLIDMGNGTEYCQVSLSVSHDEAGGKYRVDWRGYAQNH